MRKCKICGTALDGVMGKIKKIFFNQYPSDKGQKGKKGTATFFKDKG